IFRLRKSGFLTELRIVDVFFSSPDPKAIRRALQSVTSGNRPDVVTMLRDGKQKCVRWQQRGFFGMHRQGLTITYRELNDATFVALAEDIRNWYFSAGTLELL